MKDSIHMGLGMALSEELRVENGRTMNHTGFFTQNRVIFGNTL